MPCASCGSNSLTPEDTTGNLFCTSCGTIQKYSNYDPQIFGRDGPTGSCIHLGSSGIGSSLNYKDKKIYESKKIIDDTASQLGLTDEPAVVDEIRSMINQITKGEFGLGEWFPILIGACAYVVKRKANVLFSLAEIAYALNCDGFELGRMITRVVRFLNLKLPEVDIFIMFEGVFRNLHQLRKLESDKLGQMRKQGIFMLNCAVKWFLSTGRRPIPVVVAVLVFVAEVNGVDVRIKDVAQETHCMVSTCRKRYSELLEALVKVAQALPWGKDVNVKNFLKNAMYVMSDVVSECFKKDVEHEIGALAGMVWKVILGESGRGRSERFEFQTCWNWWNGKSEFSKKLFLKKLLEKDVGLDIMPPSFVKGCMNNKRRRAKINSAKVRIGKIMHPSGTDTGDNNDVRLSECEYTGKRRKRKRVDEIDC
ncbi:hypothetical protein EZV62_026862 [Acer yangbiense]|uniref:BRF2-like C-terminal domain-containing protein n=1 Tax=Acer yangbiense TaxID=1000413 RepID=A0A5C7GS68_9ROSI|nr:hypothetical protein EZV62_026862 [Acer yangbiense]